MRKIKLMILMLTLVMFISANLLAQSAVLGRKIFENGKYPQPVGNTGKIAFTHYSLENNVPKFEFVIGDPVTGKFEKYGLEFENAPPLGTAVWSKKGDRVAAVRKDLSTCDIYEYSGTAPTLIRKLTDLTEFIPNLDTAYIQNLKLDEKELLNVANMDWSFDDKKIVFSMIKAQNGALCVLDIDSGKIRQVTPDRFGTSPSWAPDNQSIYLTALGETSGKLTQDIYRLRLEDFAAEPLIASSAQELFPDVHPSGKYLVYARMTDEERQTIYLYDLAAQKSVQLVYLDKNQSASFPTWSGDGKAVVYQLITSGQTFPDIYMIDFDPAIFK